MGVEDGGEGLQRWNHVRLGGCAEDFCEFVGGECKVAQRQRFRGEPLVGSHRVQEVVVVLLDGVGGVRDLLKAVDEFVDGYGWLLVV